MGNFMSFKIAVATSDGVNIDTEYSKAPKFLIINVDDEGNYHNEGYLHNYSISVNGCGSCESCKSGCQSNEAEFLWECSYVLATSFSHRITKLLNRIYIDTLEVRLTIAEAVPKVIAFENRRSNFGKNLKTSVWVPPRNITHDYVPQDDYSADASEDQVENASQADLNLNSERIGKNRVAFASSDGKVVNRHFGHADLFYIYELHDNLAYFVEKRSVNSCCNGGGHTIDSFNAVASTIADCRAVVVAKIGQGASSFLENKGFEVFEAPYLISRVLDKIIKDRLLESAA